MALCIIAAGKTLLIAASAFTLSWAHSVEKTEWQEDWIIENNELVLANAKVKGSGAGMDPGNGATLKDNWWVWKPNIPPVPELNLAASGATISGWKLCHDPAGECLELDDQNTDTIKLTPCEN